MQCCWWRRSQLFAHPEGDPFTHLSHLRLAEVNKVHYLAWSLGANEASVEVCGFVTCLSTACTSGLKGLAMRNKTGVVGHAHQSLLHHPSICQTGKRRDWICYRTSSLALPLVKANVTQRRTKIDLPSTHLTRGHLLMQRRKSDSFRVVLHSRLTCLLLQHIFSDVNHGTVKQGFKKLKENKLKSKQKQKQTHYCWSVSSLSERSAVFTRCILRGEMKSAWGLHPSFKSMFDAILFLTEARHAECWLAGLSEWDNHKQETQLINHTPINGWKLNCNVILPSKLWQAREPCRLCSRLHLFPYMRTSCSKLI